MERNEHALKSAGSLKTVKRLRIGKNQLYALRDKAGNGNTIMDKIVEEAYAFYRDLYSSWDKQVDNGRGTSQEEVHIPAETTEEVNKALDSMQRGKVAGENQVLADLLKDGEQIVKKLATIYTQCLTTSSMRQFCKNANKILIVKERNVKGLTN